MTPAGPRDHAETICSENAGTLFHRAAVIPAGAVLLVQAAIGRATASSAIWTMVTAAPDMGAVRSDEAKHPLLDGATVCVRLPFDRFRSLARNPGLNERALLRFSTEQLPRHQRLMAWRETFCRAVLKSDVTPIDDRDRFHAEMVMRMLPGLTVTWGSSSRLRIERPQNLVADGDDDLYLILSLLGHASAEQLGRELVLEAGGAALWSGGVPGILSCSQGYSLIQLKFPRRSLEGMVDDVDHPIMRPLDANGEALALLKSYIAALQAGQRLAEPGIQQLFATHVRDLLALILGATSDTAERARGRGLRAARLNAVRTHILENLHRPDLNVHAVAASQRITSRYLQMLFEGEGTTFSAFVLKQRLAHVHRMLTDPRRMGLAIGVIALEAGFNDLSYFNRVFRRQYGSTPSDIRMEARQEI